MCTFLNLNKMPYRTQLKPTYASENAKIGQLFIKRNAFDRSVSSIRTSLSINGTSLQNTKQARQCEGDDKRNHFRNEMAHFLWLRAPNAALTGSRSYTCKTFSNVKLATSTRKLRRANCFFLLSKTFCRRSY